MRDIVIGGLPLRFDIGTLRQIAATTGKDPLAPLEGLDTYSQAAHILHGANLRAHIKNGNAANAEITSIDHAHQVIEDNLPQFVIDIVRAFNLAMRITDNISERQSANQGSDQEKKMDLTP